ncbi:MAG: hypothetical protein EZS28_052784, partial [Streblomastix strix]
NCKPDLDPIGCICPIDRQQLLGISTQACACNGDNDPRRGITCAVSRVCESNDLVQTPCLCSEEFADANCTCTEDFHDNQQCICDISGESGVYDLSTCRSTKTCIDGDFDNPLPVGCTPPDCTSASQTYKCNCKPDLDPIGCNCPTEPQQLVGIRTDACPCNGNDDPRRGTTCKVTRVCSINDLVQTPCLCSEAFTNGNCICTEEYHDDQQCMCDQSGETEVYDLSTCRSTKTCTGGTFDTPSPTGCTPPDCTSASQTYKCNCKPDLDPIGCICPIDRQQLLG